MTDDASRGGRCRGARLALALAACCLIAADTKEGHPIAPGDTVCTRAGAELLIEGEVVAKLDEFVELKVLKIEGDLLHCRIVSGDGTASGTFRKTQVAQHPLALRRKEGLFRFVICRVAPREKDAIQRRDKMADGDTRHLLQRELARALKAQREAILPPGIGGRDLALAVKRLSEAGAGAAENVKVTKKLQNQLFSTYVLYGAYLTGEVAHADIEAAMAAEVDKLARQNGWDADALRSGVAAAVASLDTAVGGNTTHVAGRFRDKPAR